MVGTDETTELWRPLFCINSRLMQWMCDLMHSTNEPARRWIEHYRVRCKKWDFCVYHLPDWKTMSILTQFRYFLKKIGHSRPLLTLFSSFQYCYSKKMFIINFAFGWIWTVDLWCWEQPLYQLSHKDWRVFKPSLVKEPCAPKICLIVCAWNSVLLSYLNY